MTWKRKRFLIPVLFVTFVVLLRVALSSIEQYPSLATELLPDGQELRLHAVLKPEDPAFRITWGSFLNRSTRKLSNRGSGLTFVFSCRDPDDNKWLGFDWFGSISVQDRHGVDVLANTDGISVKQRHWSYSRSSGSEGNEWWDPEFQPPLTNQNSYRFLAVSIATPEISIINQINILDADGNEIAKLKVKISLPPADPSFEDDQISFVASNKDWQGTISELEYFEYHGDGQTVGRRTSQASLAARLKFERNGLIGVKGDFVQGPASFKDPMGNQHGVQTTILPRGPRVWKYSTSVARNTTAEFPSNELKPIGTFTIPTTVQTKPTTSQQSPRHIAVVPPGKHETPLNAQVFSIQHSDEWNYRPIYGQFALGASLSNLPESERTSSGGGGSSSGEAWKANYTLSMNLGQSSNQIQVSSEVYSSSEFDDTLYSTNSPWPLVMLALEPDERNEDHVHHLIVRDSSGTAVPVRPCFHSIKHIPVYAIGIESSHSQPLSLFYHSEQLRKLEFTIPSPHTVIERPVNPSESFTARLVPDGDTWLMFSK